MPFAEEDGQHIQVSTHAQTKEREKSQSVFSLWALAAIDYCADEMYPGVSLFIQITLFFSLLCQQNKTKAGSTQNKSGMSAYHKRPKESNVVFAELAAILMVF